jgi:single-stranded-DNA-specific exonuclease
MNGITSTWKWRSPSGRDPGSPSSQPNLADRVLEGRSIKDPAAFLDSSYGRIAPPEGLAGAVEAGERLARALEEGSRIVIHGDYDFDGISASAILQRALRLMAPSNSIEVVLPNRYEGGYGLSVDGLKQIRAEGADLVIAVDCGITAIEAIQAAAEDGLEVMVLDHHRFVRDHEGGILLPPASVVVHPGLPVTGVEQVGTDHLCGAAVAFKVVWATARSHFRTERVPSVMKQELVEATILAGLGTIADVMPLVEENRALAALALRGLPGSKIPGLRALLLESGHGPDDGPVHEEVIQFQLAPRINALGRFGSPMPAVELLTSVDSTPEGVRASMKLAREISSINLQRREAQRAIVEEAITRAEAEGQTADDHPVIVLADPGWKRGLVGPACAKLVDRFARPVILFEACSDGIARGSARSIEGYSIHAGLESASELLESYGGHAAAAGCAVKIERLDDLRVALVEHASQEIASEDLTSVIEIDCRAVMAEIDEVRDIEVVRGLAPFGPGHPRPTVLIETVRPIESKWVGADQGTLQLRFAGEGARTVKAVWFGAGRHREAVEKAIKGGAVDLVATPDLNRWQGRVEPNLMIQDLRAAE